MTARARLTVDLAKLTENTARLIETLPGVDIVGVTKMTCGTPEVARAILDGGAVAIGESRLENAARLRDAGIEAPIWLLRATPPELATETVRLTDVSLATELRVVEALDAAAGTLGRRHAVVAMVDLGDLREGMLASDLPDFLERAESLPNIDVAGIGVSLTCYGGIVPTAENLGELARLARDAEARLGRKLLVSGGMSSSIDAAISGELPSAVNTLRIGESILLGCSTVTREPFLDLHTDAIVVEAPVIECKVKPSMPIGTCAQDAFGNVPVFEDRGTRRRAICALGRQDAAPEGLHPLDPRVGVLGASSDHLIVDVDDLPEPPALGETLRFVPGYGAALHLFTSPYVDKAFI